VRSHLELAQKKSPRRFLEWIELNLDRFTAWGLVLYLIAVEEVAPEKIDRLAMETLDVESIDLQHIASTAPNSTSGRRNQLASEISALKRQMRKLYPDRACLRERA
jgi:hypothetical protein